MAFRCTRCHTIKHTLYNRAGFPSDIIWNSLDDVFFFAEELKDLCVMKRILEVLRYGENDIRFHTDIDPSKDPTIIQQTITELALAMMTTLWGGNEQAVLAMVRALAIADLGVSVNRRQMVRFLDDASAVLEDSLRAARKAFEETGGTVMVFGPGVTPPKKRS